MFYELLKLQILKTVRSVTLNRKIVTALILTFFGFIFFSSLLMIGVGLPDLLKKITARQNVTLVLNTLLIFFFLLEIMYRFFLQKITVIELEHYLHLPVGRPKIIRFLLFRSFITPYNIIGLLLFAPFCMLEINPQYGAQAAFLWLLNIVLLSWSIHWAMLWYKQKYGDTFRGLVMLLGFFAAVVGTSWYNWFNIGAWVEPYFSAPLHSIVPVIGTAIICYGAYIFVFRFYRKHAYLEELKGKESQYFLGESLSLFSGFGTAGAMADAELKLILRHKKSRAYLVISLLFLAYGLLFYTDESMLADEGIPWLAIIAGIFITGMFMMHYGQLYLSWNSPSFDFYINRRYGIRTLVRGKYLVFCMISFISFILSIPYVYFGWNILWVHTATFLFNLGINIHIIIYLSLWKPKPMDLGKGGLFNYEGMGVAQFLMAIPMVVLPYTIYFSAGYFVNNYMALTILGGCGLAGILLNTQLNRLHAKNIEKQKYAISASFRQEL